jgi:ribosomal protein S18 acetylase RimI-like enzyme
VQQEPPAIEVRKATQTEVPQLTAVLVRAFDDDPLLNWAIRHDARRAEAFMRLFVLVVCRLTLPYDEVYTTADLRAVALWTPPERWRQGWQQQLNQLPDWIAIVGLRRLRRIFGPINGLLTRHPRTPHFYLPFIGVDPAFQHRGLGTAVLQPVLARCDLDGLGVYLENTNVRNLRFYEGLGFRTVEMYSLAADGPTIWRMWREPQLRA